MVQKYFINTFSCIKTNILLHKIYTFVMMVYQYNYHNSGQYPSIVLSCFVFKTQLYRSVCTSQETRYIPLRAQQVNAIYRFVTMVH
jgi:hypothetical protein